MTTKWMTVAEAAKRVGKSRQSIHRWAHDGLLTVYMGRVREEDVLRADAAVRARRGRPRAVTGNSITVPVRYHGKLVGSATVDITTGAMTATITALDFPTREIHSISLAEKPRGA